MHETSRDAGRSCTVANPEDRARAKGIWDAVDTSPDLGGQIHHASA